MTKIPEMNKYISPTVMHGVQKEDKAGAAFGQVVKNLSKITEVKFQRMLFGITHIFQEKKWVNNEKIRTQLEHEITEIDKEIDAISTGNLGEEHSLNVTRGPEERKNELLLEIQAKVKDMKRVCKQLEEGTKSKKSKVNIANVQGSIEPLEKKLNKALGGFEDIPLTDEQTSIQNALARLKDLAELRNLPKFLSEGLKKKVDSLTKKSETADLSFINESVKKILDDFEKKMKKTKVMNEDGTIHERIRKSSGYGLELESTYEKARKAYEDLENTYLNT